MTSRAHASAPAALRAKVTAMLSVASLVCSLLAVPQAQASWNPTLLVNTEAFMKIDDGDASTDIELRFGETGEEIQWNVTESRFDFSNSVDINGDLEVHGTASGVKVHAQDDLTSSGTLTVEGQTWLEDDVTFGSGLVINGVKYTFPYGDASSSGKVLASDGSGQLSWTEPNKTEITLSGDSGTDQTIGHGDTLEVAGGDSISTVTSATDTVTIDVTDDSINGTELADTIDLDATTEIDLNEFDFNIDMDSTGSFQILDGSQPDHIFGYDGSIIFNELGQDADFRIEGDNDENLGFFDASTDRLGIGTATPDTKLEVIGTISGATVYAADTLASSGTLVTEGQVTFASLTSCENLETDANGVLSCNTTDYITELELDTEAELEAQLTDVTNVLTNNDDTDDLSEGSTNLYFTDERVDDRVGALLQAGTGITLFYDDAGDTLTISATGGSGSNVSLSPEYSGAVYFADGSNNVGQLVLDYDSTNKENYYKWTSSDSDLQDYSIAIRVQVPETFSHWDATAPIQIRNRVNAASSDDNKITVTMLDTAGSSVSLTGGADLANTSWTTTNITGPEGAGTYTPGEYITLIVQVFARTTNSGEANAGFINLNWGTSSP